MKTFFSPLPLELSHVTHVGLVSYLFEIFLISL